MRRTLDFCNFHHLRRDRPGGSSSRKKKKKSLPVPTKLVFFQDVSRDGNSKRRTEELCLGKSTTGVSLVEINARAPESGNQIPCSLSLSVSASSACICFFIILFLVNSGNVGVYSTTRGETRDKHLACCITRENIHAEREDENNKLAIACIPVETAMSLCPGIAQIAKVGRVGFARIRICRLLLLLSVVIFWSVVSDTWVMRDIHARVKNRHVFVEHERAGTGSRCLQFEENRSFANGTILSSSF